MALQSKVGLGDFPGPPGGGSEGPQKVGGNISLERWGGYKLEKGDGEF